MFKKCDDDFDEMVADPIHRSAKIADLALRCKLIWWCAVILIVCAGLETYLGAKTAAGAVLCAAIILSICLKMDSDLRLMKAIDRLQKDKDEKPTA